MPEKFERPDLAGVKKSLLAVAQELKGKSPADLADVFTMLSPEAQELLRNLVASSSLSAVDRGEARGASVSQSAKRSPDSGRASEQGLESDIALITDTYNSASRGRIADHMKFEAGQRGAVFFTVSNARERMQNRDLPPIFKNMGDTGSYYAVQNRSGSYSVFPSLGKDPWRLRNDAAMSEVFNFPEVSGKRSELVVKKPARFERNGDEWKLVEKGELGTL